MLYPPDALPLLVADCGVEAESVAVQFTVVVQVTEPPPFNCAVVTTYCAVASRGRVFLNGSREAPRLLPSGPYVMSSPLGALPVHE
jgi:hypothetical protein